MVRPLVRSLALAVALVLASCSDAPTISGPADVDASFSHSVPGPDGDSFRLIAGQLPTTVQSVSQLIGPEGGELVLPGPFFEGSQRSHVLTVPAGAVTHPTLFVMEIASDTHIMVDLHAYKQVGNGNGNGPEVGHLGFKTPVFLKLSYAFGEDVGPPPRLKIVHLVDGEVKEKANGRAWNARHKKIVEGELHHFSRYAVAAE